MIHLILLSGGSGTRLWPLSNSSRSKQFLKVLRDEQGNHISMVQCVIGQIRAVDADVDVTIATCANQNCAIFYMLHQGFELGVCFLRKLTRHWRRAGSHGSA